MSGYEDKVLEYKKEYNLNKLEYIVTGGKTQPQSISNCIDRLNGVLSDDDIIVVHAGNRPLVQNRLIDESISMCKEKGNAVAYIECPEVLFTKDTNEVVKRENIMRLQTPQTFKYADMKEAYNFAKKIDFEGIASTADLMHLINKKLNFYKGSEYNIKITFREDLEIFKNLLNK